MSTNEQLSQMELIELANKCVYCGYCSICPTYQEKNWEYYHPRGILELIKLYSDPKYKSQAEDYLFDAVFACTMCKACEDICVVNLPLLAMWEQIRHEAFIRGRWNKTLLDLYNRVKDTHNIYGLKPKDRIKWLEDLDGSVKQRIRKKSKIAIFFGCRASYEKSLQKVSISLMKLFKHAGENFTILKEDEWCCGSPIFLGGGIEVGRSIAEHNFTALKNKGVKTLIVSCAEGYHTFKTIYPKILGEKWDIEVKHVSEFILELLQKGKIKFERGVTKKVTYKDPCKLARFEGIIEQPRLILNKIKGINFEELSSNKAEALCCGGGGLLDITNHKLAMRVNDKLMKEIAFSEAKIVVTSCPICQKLIEEGAKRNNINIETKDLVELIAELLAI